MAFTPTVYAQRSTQTAPNPQQQRMKSCNAEAGQEKLTGEARKTFMSE
jgi:psiF repeat-containing protein